MECRKLVYKGSISMDTPKLKAFATYARNDLLNRLEKKIGKNNFNNDTSLDFLQEVSYTLFIRFICIKYMEVNGYLDKNKFFAKYGLDSYSINRHKYNKDESENFSKDFQILNSKLSTILPEIFYDLDEHINSLLPKDFLAEDSFINKISFYIDDKYFLEKPIIDHKEENIVCGVEIIGWLHQYYICEQKDKIFSNLKKNIKISTENIPVATQFFTPKWIVQHMVESTLGKIEINGEIEKLKNLSILDPCMGTGHILIYVFDVLYEKYIKAGYDSKDIPRMILENNLYGLDIDSKVFQITSFSMKMKASEYNKNFLYEIEKEPCILNIAFINESNSISEHTLKFIKHCKHKEIYDDLCIIIDNFKNAKNYGSLVKIKYLDINIIKTKIKAIQYETIEKYELQRDLKKILYLIKQWEILNKKYDICITNPPYMGIRGMNKMLADYLSSEYPLSKHDLSSVYMEVCYNFLLPKGLCAMINPHSWMFLSSFYNLRCELLQKVTFIQLIHLGNGIFEDNVGTIVQNVMFIFKKDIDQEYMTTCIDLTKKNNNEERKETLIKIKENKKIKECFYKNLNEMKDIPNVPFAYWISEKIVELFRNNPKLEVLAKPRQGMATSDNKRFLRKWFEVDYDDICFDARDKEQAILSNKKWFPYNKGGESRKWYGNREFLINWENDGYEVKEYAKSLYKFQSRTIKNEKFYFRSGITYTFISTEMCSRYTSHGCIFDVAGSSIFLDSKEDTFIILGLLCSKVANLFIDVINPTFNTQVGDMKNIPIIQEMFTNSYRDKIIWLVKENIRISKENWDLFENSWDFNTHPFVLLMDNGEYNLEKIYIRYKNKIENQFKNLKENEEELNKLFIDMYKLNNELTYVVPYDKLTLRGSCLKEDVKSFISYAVGCILGRYKMENYKSVDILLLGEDTNNKNHIFKKFLEFLCMLYGKDTLENNISFIATALGSKGLTNNMDFINDYFNKSFYKDHVKFYGKTPVYWLFNDEFNNSFKALVYMKNITIDLLKQIVYIYIKPLSSSKLYTKAITQLIKDNVKINLDEGITVNYNRFQNVKFLDDDNKTIMCNVLWNIN